LLCAACCAAPAAAQRRFDFGVTGTVLYDSNVVRGSKALALARGLVQEDVRFTPAATFDLSLPVGRHALFASGLAGYDFYARNSRLDRERLEARSGVNLRFAQCRADIFGVLARRQAELDDLTLGPVDNRETIRSVNFEGSCQRAAGLSPRLQVQYQEGRNSRIQRRISNLDRFEIEGGLGYTNLSLGTVELFGRYLDARYPDRTFAFGGARRPDGFESYTAGLGYARELGTALRGSVAAGYTEVRPERPDLPRFDGLTYRAELRFNPLGRLRGTLAGGREVDASNRIDVSYFVEDSVSARLEYSFSPNARSEAGLTLRERAFEGANQLGLGITDEETRSVFAALIVAATPKISIRIDAEHERRETNNPLFNYKTTQLGVTTALKF
jgi:hypothetical protein